MLLFLKSLEWSLITIAKEKRYNSSLVISDQLTKMASTHKQWLQRH